MTVLNLSNFNSKQLEQIKKGLENNINVNTYADPNFDFHQMKEIRQTQW